MPEDASFGAFSFSLKTFFFHYKGKKKSSSLSHFETAGLAGLPGPATLLPLGQGPLGGQEAAGRGNSERRVRHLPLAEPRSCLASLGPPPLAWPQRLLFLTLESPS